MFDIGFQELVVIFIVALLVFGPEKLPEIGKTLGRWMIEIRRGIQNAKSQMDSEFEEMEKRRASPDNEVGSVKETKPPEGPAAPEGTEKRDESGSAGRASGGEG